MCRGDLRSPVCNSCYRTNFLQASIGRSYYLDIKQNLFYQFVSGSAGSQTPAILCSPKGWKKGAAQTPRRLWCGSLKCSPIDMRRKNLVYSSCWRQFGTNRHFSLCFDRSQFLRPAPSLHGVWVKRFAYFDANQSRPRAGRLPAILSSFSERKLS